MSNEQARETEAATHHHGFWDCTHTHRYVGSPATPWAEHEPAPGHPRTPHRHVAEARCIDAPVVVQWAALHKRCDGDTVVGV